MNYSAATTPEQQFLRWIGTQYGFTGDTYAVFLSRFNPENKSKTNQILILEIAWNKDPVNKNQKIQDELDTICEVLKQHGCPIEKPKRGRQPKGQSPWEKADKWLWETKFSEWKKTQNQVIPDEQVQKEAVCNFLNQIITDFQYIKLFHTTQPIILKDQYIPIQVTLERKYTHTIETTWSYAESEAEMKRAYSLKHLEESKPTQVDWPEAKKQHQRLMVLADPGMGKTTLLKKEAYLTAQAALKSLEDNSQTLEDLVIPIFLRLSEIATATKEVTAKVSDAILKLLESKYEKYFPDIKDFLADKLKDGKCLLLLDALDEVAKEARNNLSEKLNTFIRNYDCSIICTSRIVGYSGAFLDKAKDVEIVPFNEPQINQYIETWFKIAAEFINDDSVSAGSLIRELQTKPQIRGLVRNPLLLSLICSLYQEKGITLPARRCEVYEQAVKYMLGKWRKKRNQEVEESWIDVKSELLEEVAYKFSCDNQEIFTVRELRKAMDSYLKKDDIPSDFKNVTSSPLITELSEEDGILQKLHENGDQYLFLHRTFQEYFTACYLQRSTNGVELAKAHFWDYEWHETLSLMAGLMKNPIPLLEAILAERDDIFSTLLLLGGRCVTECKIISHPLIEKIVNNIYIFWHRYPFNNFITSVIVLLGKTYPEIFSRLQLDIKHIDNNVRVQAAFVLGKIGNPLAIKSLIEALNDELIDVNREAAQALVNINTSEVVTSLFSVLKNSDPQIRWMATQALGLIKDPQVIEPLIYALNDNDWRVFEEAAMALAKIGNSQAIDALVSFINHPNYHLRQIVISSLGQIRNSQATDALIFALKHENNDVRWQAAIVLSETDDFTALALLTQGKIFKDQGLESLIFCLSDEDSYIRWQAVRVLGKIGDSKVVQLLLALLKDKDESVRCKVAEVLGRGC